MQNFSKLLYFSGGTITSVRCFWNWPTILVILYRLGNIAFQKVTVIKYTLDMAKAAARGKKART